MSTHPLLPDEDDINSVLASGAFTESVLNLDQYRKENHEFKKWLQIFFVECEQRRDGSPDPWFHVTHVLPWLCSDDKIDLDYHLAVKSLGAYDKYPLVWRSMGWKLEAQLLSPTYGLFTANPSRAALSESLTQVTGIPFLRAMKDTRFWIAMEKHVLVLSRDGALDPHVWTNITTEKL